MESSDSSDLDYHITFPAPVTYCQDDKDCFSPPIQVDNSKEPVVILLGWLGCKERYLMKYSGIYSQKCITILYTAPSSDVMFNHGNLEKKALKLLELIQDLDLESNPIIFHVFSNGGGMLYQYLSKHIYECPKTEFTPFNVVGCIFDSCPSDKCILIAVKAYIRQMNTNFVLKYIAGFFLIFVFFMIFNLQRILPQRFQLMFNDYWSYMRKDPLRCPQLYLFSKADDLVDYKYVHDVAKYRESLGITVIMRCWDDSPHVQHFLKYKSSYADSCLDFIDMVLNNREITDEGITRVNKLKDV